MMNDFNNTFSKIFVTSSWERIHAFTASTAVWFQAAGDEDSSQWRIQGEGVQQVPPKIGSSRLCFFS